MLPWLGRAYVMLSVAALPAAALVSALLIAGFKERGPQSQGLGALAAGVFAVLVALTINAALAGLLAWLAPAARPSWLHVLIAFAALSTLAGGGFLLLRHL